MNTEVNVFRSTTSAVDYVPVCCIWIISEESTAVCQPLARFILQMIRLSDSRMPVERVNSRNW